MKVFKYRFTEENSAQEFMNYVNNQTGGYASHPFCGRGADTDTKAVMVKGVGSVVFDMQLKAKCDDLCFKLGGWPMPTT